MKKILVTKSFLPIIEDYELYLKEIWKEGTLTNQGLLLQNFEAKMKSFLNVHNFQFVTNGTIALQLALNALEINCGEVITTPFSFIATVTSILWERCSPIFCDIESETFTIDTAKIEALITPRTKAIMPVHVFGYACNVEKIQQIADKYNLKVIYDGAHAFASNYKNRSLLSYGDITTCSFHATKLFHTVEGGACIAKDEGVFDRIRFIKRFGEINGNYECIGINAKQSEFHAAMGLANIPYINKIISERKRISDLYDLLLQNIIKRPGKQEFLDYNYAYYPVLFNSEKELLNVFSALNKQGIYPRRYFYPSLNTLPYLNNKINCPISEDISSRIACLPLYVGLDDSDVERICSIIRGNI